jgi:hypothetical protein
MKEKYKEVSVRATVGADAIHWAQDSINAEAVELTSN